MKRKKNPDPNDRYYPTGTKQRRFKDEKRRRVIVCGSRKCTDLRLVYKKLDKLTKGIRDPIIVHGDADGADTLAGKWAMRRGLNCMRFPAQWTLHGKRAGPIRNGDMAKYAVEYKKPMCIAFKPKAAQSKGTENMIEQARKFKIKLKIVRY